MQLSCGKFWCADDVEDRYEATVQPQNNHARIFFLAGVAQSVEQFIRNEKVEGSIPFTGTNHLLGDCSAAMQQSSRT